MLAVVAVAAAIVVAVLMTRFGPVQAAQPPGTLSTGMHTSDYAVSFRMDPLAPGERTVEVKLGDHDGTPLPGEPKIELTAFMLNQAPVDPPIVGKYLGEGRYQFDHVNIGGPGTWFFELQVWEPGAAQAKKVTLDFEVPVK